MLRGAAGCRGLWQSFEGLEGIRKIATKCPQGREGVQEIQYEARDSLHALLSPACKALGPEGGPPKLSNVLPCIINGAMTEENGWNAGNWSSDDLIVACDGETLVPVEVSINGGDYRDLYRAAEGSSRRRQFEAGVPVPLSFLLQHIQQLSDPLEQVSRTILVKAGNHAEAMTVIDDQHTLDYGIQHGSMHCVG